ncbi:DMT family transporter [Arenibaculum pallidiluteum]|uniref:DMT family transporter n=1 Tax=Arenibaculum pallidiluteum TaxID=2812559 RepID=UPI001A969446|nr:EamA family transporter [Arenibaculum pallidiluteum]
MLINHAPTRLPVELALLATLAFLWGASYTFIRIGVGTIPPVTLIAARTAMAGLLLLALMRLRGIALPRDRGVWGRLMVQACLNSAVPFTLIAWAELTVEAGLATILNATTPVFAFLLSLALARGQATDRRKLAGVVLGLAGICLIVGPGVLGGLGRDVAAQLAIVAATVCYAGAALFGRNFSGLHPMVPAAGSLICGAALLIPLSLVVDRPWTLSPSPASLGALLGLSVFSTALAFVIYFRLIRTLGSVGTTAQAYLRVPFGVAIGMIFLGEQPTPTAWAGLAFVVLGVAAMTMPARAGARVPAAQAAGDTAVAGIRRSA